MNKSRLIILVLLSFLTACGGSSGTNTDLVNSAKVGDAPDNLSEMCTFQGRTEEEPIYADEVIKASCGTNAANPTFKNISYYKNIETLSFSKSDMQDSNIMGLEGLLKLSKLKNLNISRFYYDETDVDTEMWGKLELESLNLNAATIPRIGEINTLKELRLLQRRIDSFSFEELASLPNLRKLDLELVGAADESASYNIALLGNSNSLEELTISEGRHGLGLTFRVEDFEVLVSNAPKLKFLSFLTPVVIYDISFIDKSESLEVFEYDNTFSDISTTSLSCGDKLAKVVIGTGAAEQFRFEENCKNLIDVEIDGSLLEIPNLEVLENIEKLNLSFNSTQDISGTALLSNLKELYLAWYDYDNTFSDISTSSLSCGDKLAKVVIGTGASEQFRFEENCKNLIDVKIYGSLLEIPNLEALENIKKLDISYNKIQDISGIALLSNLEELNLARNEIFDVSPLYDMTHLEKLDITHNNISLDDLEILRQRLPTTEIISD